jgi:hypothetical protein
MPIEFNDRRPSGVAQPADPKDNQKSESTSARRQWESWEKGGEPEPLVKHSPNHAASEDMCKLRIRSKPARRLTPCVFGAPNRLLFPRSDSACRRLFDTIGINRMAPDGTAASLLSETVLAI